MSRIWHQWIDGNKVVWPADELPHPQTVFKANFLNQFIAWKKYVSKNNSVARFISPGDIIQGADFWNGMRYTISGFWGKGWLLGYLYAPDSDLISPGVKTAPAEYINESTESLASVMDHPVAEINRGDNLQSILPAWLMNLRWQLDASSVYVDWGGVSGISSNGTLWRYEWNRQTQQYEWSIHQTWQNRNYCSLYGDWYESRTSRIDTIENASASMMYPVQSFSIIFEGFMSKSYVSSLINLTENQFWSVGPTFQGPYPPVLNHPIGNQGFWALQAGVIFKLMDILPTEYKPPLY